MTNNQANELNDIIKNNSNIFDLFSEKGKNIFYPKSGILAQAAQAKDKNINATIGIALEDDGTPMVLKSISELIQIPTEDSFKYAPSFGKNEIRQKWEEMIKEKNPSIDFPISKPIVTSALTHGLSILGYLFLENEEIIVPTPFWGNYKLIFENAYNSKIVSFELFQDGKFNIDGLYQMLNSNGEKKVLLLNFPNNPTGYTPLVSEIEKIVNTIKDACKNGKKIVAICDDAYFGLVFEDGVYTESIFTKLGNLHENLLAVKVDGPTKEDYVWGFRVGFITYAIKGGNEKLYTALEEKTAGAVRGNISNAAHLSQSLILKAFTSTNYETEKKEKFETLQTRYKKVKEIIGRYSDRFTPLPFNSGYFMCIDIKGKDPEEVRKILLEKYSTGTISLNKYLRIAFSATPYDKIEELFENIYKALG